MVGSENPPFGLRHYHHRRGSSSGSSGLMMIIIIFFFFLPMFLTGDHPRDGGW